MAATVSMNVLREDTGEGAPTLQHWANLGILRAEPDTDGQGRGRHRAFNAEPYFGERKWALLASALHRYRIPAGDIHRIIEVLRRNVGSPESPHYDDPSPDAGFKDQERDRERRFLLLPFGAALMPRKDSQDESLLFLSIDRSSASSAGLFMHLTSRSFLASFHLHKENGQEPSLPRVELYYLDKLTEFLGNYPETFCLNLTRIFAPLRR